MISLNAEMMFALVKDEMKTNPVGLNFHYVSKFRSYYKQAGLTTILKQNFFTNHYVGNLQTTLDEFQRTLKFGDRIVDLGGGMGTQAIFFAYHGFKVTVLDMDEQALKIGKKRKHYYENKFSKDLDIDFIECDAIKFDWQNISSIKGIYSLFAFNMVQPTSKIMEIIFKTTFKEGGICIIQDGNATHPVRRFIYPRPSLSASALNNIFVSQGFEVFSKRLLSFPPVFHFMFGQSLACKLEEFWAGRLNTNLSWLHIFKKDNE